MSSFDDLLTELRTQEADGEGTDVRLVMLEAIVVEGRLHALDQHITALGGRPPGLLRAVRQGDLVLPALESSWRCLDLEEHTTRLREVDDLLCLLLR